MILGRFRRDREQRDTRPFYKVYGWHRDGDRFTGCYRVGSDYWRGAVELIGDKDYQAYIENPPTSVLNGRFKNCLRQEERSTERKQIYRVHMSPRPNSVEGAIRGVEKAIASRD